MSFGKSDKKTNTSQQQQSQNEPWAPAIPYLTRMLQDADTARGNLGPSGDQLDAYAQLKRNAASGNPFQSQIGQLTSDAFNTQSRSGMVDTAYGDMKMQMADVAAGKNQDILSDPRLQAMLQQVGGDAQNRIQGIFAGAGRNVTGNAAGQGAIARGVTSAQLPILMQEYARQQGRTDDAIRSLGAGGMQAATTGQQLDANALAQRTSGVQLADAYQASRDQGANTILNLDQQLKSMPFEDLSMYASLLLPAAGLGGQQAGSGTSQSQTKGSSFGFNLGDIGKVAAAGASMFSDEEVKEDITEVGETKDGQKIYRYRYKGDPTWHIGLIAQEVEKEHPEAVGEVGGIKTVDYRKATEDAARMNKRA